MIKKYIYNLSSNKLVLFIILYFAIGAYIFSSYYINLDYINKFINVFSNSNFNLIFVFPSFILLISYVYKQLNNINLIIRFSSRKKYLYFLFKIVFSISSILYLLLLLIVFTMCNITSHDGFNILSVSLFISIILKSWLWLVAFSLIIISFYLFFNKSVFANGCSFIFIIILYFSKYLLGIVPFIEIILPNIYLYASEKFDNVLENNLYSTVYFIIVYLIILLLLSKIILKKEFYQESEE